VSIDNGEVQDRVAFQRFFNRRSHGFSRWVVGVSCSSDGNEVAYKVLAGFSGPAGDIPACEIPPPCSAALTKSAVALGLRSRDKGIKRVRGMRRVILAAAAMLALSTVVARADEGVEIDCKKTNLSFEAPGYTVKCTDYSRSTISLSELNAATQTYVLFAMSEADITFLQAYSKRVLGGTRIYLHRRSLESELENSFSFKFSDWADEADVGDFEVKHVTVTFESGEPSECIAFRKLGARRYEGVAGLTAGFACSANGRDHAVAALKHFVSQQ